MKNFFYEKILLRIEDHIKNDGGNEAFCIGNNIYTYSDFGSCIKKIWTQIKDRDKSSRNVGLVINNDLETYASIIALWYEGCCYVPLHPFWPIERCQNIIEQVNLDFILDSSKSSRYDYKQTILTSDLSRYHECDNIYANMGISDDYYAYILFTSGSTGVPKGVPITRGNLAAFVDSMENIGLDLSCRDKCLQPFDLSFDFSVSGYVMPLVQGAEIFTVPLNKNKITSIAKILFNHKMTILQMVPSMMRNLLPYLDEFDLTSIRYNIFCGEALSAELTAAWHRSNPNMITYNMYGPTEDTVFCTYYVINRNNQNDILNSNDTVAVGKSFKNSDALLLDENGAIIETENIEGELCLSGQQLTPGYWNNSKENKERFIYINDARYYRSGDLCCYSKNKNIMYIGRIDNQIKLNGFRVELGEIEHKFSNVSDGCFCVVQPYHDEKGNLSLALIIEGPERDINDEICALKKILPPYEMPSKYYFIQAIPLNQNGKVDRKVIKDIFKLK